MITIEDFHVDSNSISINYFLEDGVLEHRDFLLDEFEVFVVANHLMDWTQHYQRINGEWEEREGVHNFETWCKEYCSDDDVRNFLIHKLAN